MGSMEAPGPQPPYPLHESIKHRLDPTYASFYNTHIFDKQQVHLQPVSASRTSGILIPGGGPKLPVGKTEDLSLPRFQTEGPEVPIRVFTPEGERPTEGWPVLVYYHGGGWVLGNIDTENTVCTNICNRASCVVITTDYRYTPPPPPSPSLPLKSGSSPILFYVIVKLKGEKSSNTPKAWHQRTLTQQLFTTAGKYSYGYNPLASLSSISTPQRSPSGAPPLAAISQQ
jgi:hypothetical protein